MKNTTDTGDTKAVSDADPADTGDDFEAVDVGECPWKMFLKSAFWSAIQMKSLFDCDNCCYLMPIEYTASTAEEIESLKGIEINYGGKNHKACFEIK